MLSGARRLTVAALAVPFLLLVGGALGAATAEAAPVAVAIKGYAFAPAQQMVNVGDTITWTNNDSASHDVTSIGGPGPMKSPLLGKGQTYAVTFANAGTFQYTCTVHPDMLATMVVKPVAASAAPVTTAAPAKPPSAAASPPKATAAPVSVTSVPAPVPAASPAAPLVNAAPSPAEASIVAAAVAPAGTKGATLSSDSAQARINPLLLIVAIIAAVVVGATVTVIEPGRRAPSG